METSELKDKLKQLSDRFNQLKSHMQTEESTKTSMVLPMLQLLGYDIYNPLEVVPEFTTDVGIKKGEKIDYAILKDGEPIILIECKHWANDLGTADGQLLRYFHVSKAKIGILTNGVKYKFYTDLETKNKMDQKPFLEFTLTELRENQIEELKKFQKSRFDLENIIGTASDLKYLNQLKAEIQKQFNNPDDDFTRYFARQVYEGKVVNERVLNQFTVLLKRSWQQYLSELITERLKNALSKETEASKPAAATEAEDSDQRIVTTEEEIESFFITKSILRSHVDVSRIAYRDQQTYFSVLLDNNNRKPICRYYLSDRRKLLAIIDENKKEIRFELETLDDIYKHTEELLRSLKSYL